MSKKKASQNVANRGRIEQQINIVGDGTKVYGSGDGHGHHDKPPKKPKPLGRLVTYTGLVIDGQLVLPHTPQGDIVHGIAMVTTEIPPNSKLVQEYFVTLADGGVIVFDAADAPSANGKYAIVSYLI